MKSKQKTLRIEQKDVEPFFNGYRFRLGRKIVTVSDDEDALVDAYAASIYEQLKKQAQSKICRLRGIEEVDDDADRIRILLDRLVEASRTKARKSIGEIVHPNDIEEELYEFAVEHDYRVVEVDLPDLSGRWIDDDEEGWTRV